MVNFGQFQYVFSKIVAVCYCLGPSIFKFEDCAIHLIASLLTSIVSVLLPQNLILKAILWRIFILLRWIYIGGGGVDLHRGGGAVDLHRGRWIYTGAVGRWIYIGAVDLHRGGGAVDLHRGRWGGRRWAVGVGGGFTLCVRKI